MDKQAQKRHKAQGRSAATYLGIPHYVFRSEEFGQLSGWPLKLLIELAGQYNGHNNGDLSCPMSLLKRRGWKSSGTRDKAIKALEATRWIVTTRHGGRNVCSLFAVTWWPVDECKGKWLEVKPEKSPSNAWQKSKSVVAMRTNLAAMRTNDGEAGALK